MASSSSSFHSNPPTSWKYDVFLSFRGTDTRYTFVDHLYTTLKQQGIASFKDDEELPRGETIHPSLLTAIENSQIAVIIFSKNYADSSWCLQELEHIMKCKVERDQIVIPIFYHVDPSEVRKQEWKYGEALAKHKSKKKNVESWRRALSDAGNLSGHVPNGPETTFIQNIVKEISRRLCMAIPSDNEDLIGMENRLHDLKSKLTIDSKDVVMVGIWGLGGGGKTTLARALYDQISNKFDGCCFINNIRVESRKHGLEELQKEIISHVLKQKKEEVYGDVRNLIKIRLRRKKVLLVLDDVDDADQLKALAGSHDWFNEGSIIIITTRNQHLLNTHGVNVINNISLLNDDEAMKLFCKHALRHGNHVEGYDSLSNEVVSYARGLPLALKVMGSFLCDKDKSEWVSALARLKDLPEDDILETLKISYDGLKPIEKELFLDIACFFRGEIDGGDDPWEILEACGFHPKIGIRVLIEKALITVTEKGWYDMHDLIQEMGHYIVQGKNAKNPEKHTRVWKWEDVVTICATRTENRWIEALRAPLTFPNSGPRAEVPHSLPHAVANMKKLRWLYCYGYPATSLPRNFQPTKLVYLRLEWSSLEQLWEGTDKHLPNLKVLDLSHSQKLIRTPDFHRLPCLERIRLNYCYKLAYIDPSISHHERLISVEMRSCTHLKEFPPISGMKKLETLILSRCHQLCEFPEIQMNMERMVKLSLDGTGIKVVPSSIGQYCTNLLSLDFGDCKSLESIEGNFHVFKHLKEFNINGCYKLKIPTEGLFDEKCCLEVLNLFHTSSFMNLHPGIVIMKFLGFPPSLRKLHLGSCIWLNGDISSVLCGLSNLQELDLSYNDFSRLDCSLLQLPFLKSLDLSGCCNLVELPDLPASIAILKAVGCEKLKIVDLPTNLKWLWRISVPMESISGDVEKKVQSMLQANVVKDYSIRLRFYGSFKGILDFPRSTFMLELPRNWYNEFSGFLISFVDGGYWKKEVITIEDIMGRENKDAPEVCRGIHRKTTHTMLYFYISFGSLRHTSWWKSTHTAILFCIEDMSEIEVDLVPRRSNGDSIERVEDTKSLSESWDIKEPIEVIHDSESCIKFKWSAS